MDNKVENIKKFNCKICNKIYSSYKSMWNHTKKFHTLIDIPNVSIDIPNVSIDIPNVSIDIPNVSIDIPNISIDIPNVSIDIPNVSIDIPNVSIDIPNVFNNNQINKICKFCNKKYSSPQNRWKHEQKCKIKYNNITTNEITILKNTIDELKNKVALIIKEKGKIHPKTLQKINNQLNNINNGNINNNKIINNTYVKFGNLDYQKILNNNQIKQILNKQFMSLEESIKQIHFNDNLPEYNNVFITNLKDDIAYIFNGKQFISIRKNEMLNDLIDIHVNEINLSLEKNKNKLNEKYVIRLEKFLDMLNDDDTKFTDQDNQRIYTSYKAYKINSIKLFIYNESDKKKLEILNKIELKEKIDNNAL